MCIIIYLILQWGGWLVRGVTTFSPKKFTTRIMNFLWWKSGYPLPLIITPSLILMDVRISVSTISPQQQLKNNQFIDQMKMRSIHWDFMSTHVNKNNGIILLSMFWKCLSWKVTHELIVPTILFFCKCIFKNILKFIVNILNTSWW